MGGEDAVLLSRVAERTDLRQILLNLEGSSQSAVAQALSPEYRLRWQWNLATRTVEAT